MSKATGSPGSAYYVSPEKFDALLTKQYDEQKLREKLSYYESSKKYAQDAYSVIWSLTEAEREKVYSATGDETTARKAAYDYYVARYAEMAKNSDSYFEGMKSGWMNYASTVMTVGEVMQAATTKLFQTMEDSLVEFCMTGKWNFTDFAESVMRDLIRIQIRAAMVALVGGGSSGGSGLLGSFFGSLANNLVGSSFSMAGLQRGAMGWQGSYAAMQGFASGGIVSSPTFFPMANGTGLMGERGPEAVLPLARTTSGNLGVRSSSGGIIVNIINNNKSDVSTQSRETPEGMALDIILDQAIAKKLSQNNSMSNRTMKQNFGARESLITR
jgi:lambda family phage tail tape measure protein